MYNRVYNFFTKNNLIYLLQFGFSQQHSTFHALISLTEDIRKNLYKGNIGCVIFVDWQRAFDTVEHDILLAKFEHYGIRVLQMNSLNPTSLTENNLFLLMVIFLIKLL